MITEGEAGYAAHVFQHFNVIIAVAVHNLRHGCRLVMSDFQGYEAVFIQVVPARARKRSMISQPSGPPNRAVWGSFMTSGASSSPSAM